VDSNIIVEQNREKFMNNIESFIMQIGNEDYLNLFITSLKGEGTNEVCIAFATEFHKIQKYPKCHITTLAKQSPQKLEEALELIKISKEIEDGIGYLIFLTNSDKLYATALGMYDFSLCLVIAQQCQMDPKEYIPDLESFRALPEDMKRFRIDERLEKKDKAIKHIVETNFELFCTYCVKWELYSDALEMIDENMPNWRIIAKLYADYLFEKEDFNLAELIYIRCEFPSLARKSFVACGNWKQALSRYVSNPSEFLTTCEELIEILESTGRFEDLAYVHFEAGTYEEGILMLAKAGKWDLALMYSSKHLLAPSVFSKAIKSSAVLLLNDMMLTTSTFKSHVSRLIHIHTQPNETDFEGIEMQSDTASMASTVTSSLRSSRTSQTGKTGKQRRKMERKRAMGKGGYEDEYILKEINKIRKKTLEMQSEMSEMINGLLLIDFKVAKNMQESFGKLSILLKDDEVFKYQKVDEERERVCPVVMVDNLWKCNIWH
jgi:elongator complex protein 1